MSTPLIQCHAPTRRGECRNPAAWKVSTLYTDRWYCWRHKPANAVPLNAVAA